MNPIVKLTKQGVRDLDSGRKRIRVVAPDQAPAEVAEIGAQPDLSLEGAPVVGAVDVVDATAAATAASAG